MISGHGPTSRRLRSGRDAAPAATLHGGRVRDGLSLGRAADRTVLSVRRSAGSGDCTDAGRAESHTRRSAPSWAGRPSAQPILLTHHRAHPTHLRLTRSAERGADRDAPLVADRHPDQRDSRSCSGARSMASASTRPWMRSSTRTRWRRAASRRGSCSTTPAGRLACRAARAVMVGDDANADVAGGREAGIRTIWLRASQSAGTARSRGRRGR